MPLSVLDTKLKETWEETVRVIKEGLVIEVKGNKKYDNMPASTFNRVCHTRLMHKIVEIHIHYQMEEIIVKKLFW